MNLINVSKKYLIFELLVLFVLLPILLALSVPVWLKVIPVIIAFVYVLFLLYRHTKFKITKPQKHLFKSFWKSVMFRFIPIIIFGIIFVQIMNPEAFFRLIVEDTALWIMIVFVYSIGSVIPQEIIYRNFFFKRYAKLIPHKNIFIIVNAFLFSISHMFLHNWVILGATFFGGIAFALTYQKTRSTWLVSIEHSLYGLALFTIGIGSFLAFPS